MPTPDVPRSKTTAPNLQSLRLSRLRDYISLFNLSPTNSLGLDSLVHSKEYQIQKNLNEAISKSKAVLSVKEKEWDILTENDADVGEVYAARASVNKLSNDLLELRRKRTDLRQNGLITPCQRKSQFLGAPLQALHRQKRRTKTCFGALLADGGIIEDVELGGEDRG